MGTLPAFLHTRGRFSGRHFNYVVEVAQILVASLAENHGCSVARAYHSSFIKKNYSLSSLTRGTQHIIVSHTSTSIQYKCRICEREIGYAFNESAFFSSCFRCSPLPSL